MLWMKWALIAIGIGIIIDGIGSILDAENHHGFWFDLERIVRAIAGVAVIVIGIIIP